MLLATSFGFSMLWVGSLCGSRGESVAARALLLFTMSNELLYVNSGFQDSRRWDYLLSHHSDAYIGAAATTVSSYTP